MSQIFVARLDIVVLFGKMVLRCRSFEPHKSRYASDIRRGEGLRGLLPLATSIQMSLGAGGCMTAGLEADLTEGKVKAAGCIVRDLEAVRAACVESGSEAAKQRWWRRHRSRG